VIRVRREPFTPPFSPVRRPPRPDTLFEEGKTLQIGLDSSGSRVQKEANRTIPKGGRP
jgi:hypothetical protein